MHNINFFQDEKIKETLNLFSEGIQILDSELRYIYLNRACILQARESEERLLGKKMTEVYPYIVETELYKKIQGSLRDKKIQEFINEFTYPDGERAYFLLKIYPIEDGIIILSTDISRIKENEYNLKKANQLLSSIRQINQLIVREQDRKRLIDSATKILTDSNLFRISLIVLDNKNGFSHYSIQGDNRLLFEFSDMLVNDRLPECMKKSRRANIIVKSRYDSNICKECPSFAQYCKEGETIVLPISYGATSYGTMMCVAEKDISIGEVEISLLKEICGDIAYSIRATEIEKELGKSLRLFENFMNNINSIMATLDQFNNITYINPLINQFGFDDQEILNKPFLTLIPRNEKDTINKALANIKIGKTEEFEFHLTDHLQKIHTFRGKGRLLNNEKGEPITVLVLDDITEQRHFEQQMILSQKLESIGRLAGGIAHDFNNILSIILNYADFAMDEIDKNSPAYEYIKRVKTAGLKAAQLTSQLLLMSRKQFAEEKAVDPNKAIDELIKLLRRMIGENIQIEIIKDSKVKPVLIDPGHLDQILMNLIVNARDAMPKGGKITISTESLFLNEGYKSNKFNLKPGEYSVIIVSDTGMGMDKSILDKIFEPFFTTKESGKGTGLGLSTVYGLVRRYRGDVFVYSEVEKGSTFKIYLPSVQESEEKKEYKVEFSKGGDETILIVEDDQAIRDVVLRILKDSGYNILSAKSPDEAIKISESYSGKIDLLLTDIIMPVMDGIELSKKLFIKRPELKVLFMSGYIESSPALDSIEKDLFNFIQKPFDSTSLRKKIREVLEK